MVPAGIIVAVPELASVGDVIAARGPPTRCAGVSAPVMSATNWACMAGARMAAVRCPRTPTAVTSGTCGTRMPTTVLTSTSRTGVAATGRAAMTSARCARVAPTAPARVAPAVMAATRDVFGWSGSGYRQTEASYQQNLHKPSHSTLFVLRHRLGHRLVEPNDIVLSHLPPLSAKAWQNPG